MYRFDFNQLPILWTISHHFKSNLYIPVYHTNRRPIRNTIGVIKNRLVGMGLEYHSLLCLSYTSNYVQFFNLMVTILIFFYSNGIIISYLDSSA